MPDHAGEPASPTRFTLNSMTHQTSTIPAQTSINQSGLVWNPCWLMLDFFKQ